MSIRRILRVVTRLSRLLLRFKMSKLRATTLPSFIRSTHIRVIRSLLPLEVARDRVLVVPNRPIITEKMRLMLGAKIHIIIIIPHFSSCSPHSWRSCRRCKSQPLDTATVRNPSLLSTDALNSRYPLRITSLLL